MELERVKVEETVKGIWRAVQVLKTWKLYKADLEHKEEYAREYKQVKMDIEHINELRAMGWQHTETCGTVVRESTWK